MKRKVLIETIVALFALAGASFAGAQFEKIEHTTIASILFTLGLVCLILALMLFVVWLSLSLARRKKKTEKIIENFPVKKDVIKLDKPASLSLTAPSSQSPNVTPSLILKSGEPQYTAQEKRNLKQQMGDRTLSAEQRDKLLRSLSKFEGPLFVQVVSDKEAADFASEILDVFADAGWKRESVSDTLGCRFLPLNTA